MDPSQFNLLSQFFSSQPQSQQPQANLVAGLPSTEALKAVLQSLGAVTACGGTGGGGGGGPSGIDVTTYSAADAQSSGNAHHQNQSSTNLSTFRIPKKTKTADDTSTQSSSTGAGSDIDWMIQVYDAPVPDPIPAPAPVRQIQSGVNIISRNEGYFHPHGQSNSNWPGNAPNFSNYGGGSSRPAENYNRRESRDMNDRHYGTWQQNSSSSNSNDHRNQQRRSFSSIDDVINKNNDSTARNRAAPAPGAAKSHVRSVQGLRVPTSLSELVPRYDLLSYLKQTVTDFRRTWRHNYRTERHWNGWAYNFRSEARDKLSQMCGGVETGMFATLASYLDNKLAMKVHTGVQKSKKSTKRKRKKGGKKGVGHYMVEKQYDCHHGFKGDYRPDKHDVKVMREISRVLNDEQAEDDMD